MKNILFTLAILVTMTVNAQNNRQTTGTEKWKKPHNTPFKDKQGTKSNYLANKCFIRRTIDNSLNSNNAHFRVVILKFSENNTVAIYYTTDVWVMAKDNGHPISINNAPEIYPYKIENNTVNIENWDGYPTLAITPSGLTIIEKYRDNNLYGGADENRENYWTFAETDWISIIKQDSEPDTNATKPLLNGNKLMLLSDIPEFRINKNLLKPEDMIGTYKTHSHLKRGSTTAVLNLYSVPPPCAMPPPTTPVKQEFQGGFSYRPYCSVDCENKEYIKGNWSITHSANTGIATITFRIEANLGRNKLIIKTINIPRMYIMAFKNKNEDLCNQFFENLLINGFEDKKQ